MTKTYLCTDLVCNLATIDYFWNGMFLGLLQFIAWQGLVVKSISGHQDGDATDIVRE